MRLEKQNIEYAEARIEVEDQIIAHSYSEASPGKWQLVVAMETHAL